MTIRDLTKGSDVKGKKGPAFVLISWSFAGDILSCSDHRQNSLKKDGAIYILKRVRKPQNQIRNKPI